MKPNRSQTGKIIGVFFAITATVAAVAQQNSTPAEEQVFELSPFEVNTDEDIGYLANNTLAGTRLNTTLRDTAASISVWTPEFLDDTGMTDIEELILYSTNTVIDTNDSGASAFFNTFTNAANVLQPIRTRGILASQGIDYFKAIIPNDSYKVGRYDDSRGPNGVLFGVSDAGGLVNQTSLQGNLFKDSGRLRYSFGSEDRNRLEWTHNQVVIDKKLAVNIAGLYQDNGHWRDFAEDQRERLYAAVKWQISDKISLRINGEEGMHHRTTVQPTTPTDEGLPFYDNMMAFGVDAVTFTPTGGNPSNAMRAVGVTRRDGNPRNFSANGQNRFTYVLNDGTFFNATGTYITDGYDDQRVIHPDGTPGGATRRARINDPEFMPFERFPAGSDHFRETVFDLLTAFLDIEISKDWYINFQYGQQSADIETYSLPGPRPELYGDPNLTQGLNGPANPYAGRMYFDGEWLNDTSENQFREFRFSSSYHLDTDSKWLGRHQFAVSASRTDENQVRNQKYLVLGGNPAGRGTYIDRLGNRYENSDYRHPDQRVQTRHYIDLNDYSTWRAGGWTELPETITTDRFTGTATEYPVVFAYNTPGNLNYQADFSTDAYLAVAQSYFFDDRLVFTLGYRKDKVNIKRYGHVRDEILGWVTSKDITEDSPSDSDTIPASPEVDFSGDVRTTGLVFHMTKNFSLIANESSSIGIPDFRRTVFPDGRNAPPSKGSGRDFGVNFNLFDGRINGRVVYYETESLGYADGGNNGANQMRRIYDSFEDFLVGAPLEELLNRRQELRPEVNGMISDTFSEGIEMRLTANLTRNWRLNLNVSYTDRKAQNVYREAQAHLGLIKGEDGYVIQGATYDSEVDDPSDPGSTIEAYRIDPSAYAPDGVVASFLELAQQLPDPYNIQNTGISYEIWDMVDDINNKIISEEKRWGLRPWKFNIFTAYDFKDGFLKDWSIGGGYRWISANIIGEFEDGTEIEGDVKAEADFFLRYRTSKFSPLENGRWTFQMNIYNLFDNTDIIAGRLAQEGDQEWMIPGGRGIGYARFDVVAPRSFRFTVTYDY